MCFKMCNYLKRQPNKNELLNLKNIIKKSREQIINNIKNDKNCVYVEEIFNES